MIAVMATRKKMELPKTWPWVLLAVRPGEVGNLREPRLIVNGRRHYLEGELYLALNTDQLGPAADGTEPIFTWKSRDWHSFQKALSLRLKRMRQADPSSGEGLGSAGLRMRLVPRET